MKVFSNMDPKQNRMPKKTTGIIAEPSNRRIPIVQPEVSLKNHAGIQRNLAQFNAIEPTKIRADARARLTAQVAAVNRQISKSALYKGIRFEVHEESGRTFAVVKNRKTGQVLKQIPSDTMLARAATMWEASGLLKDIKI